MLGVGDSCRDGRVDRVLYLIDAGRPVRAAAEDLKKKQIIHHDTLFQMVFWFDEFSSTQLYSFSNLAVYV